MSRLRFPRARTLLKVAGGLLLALVLIVAIPPVRNAFALGTSKVVLFVAAPLAPNIADFKQLPETTKLTAVDGSVVAELDKDQHRTPVALKDLPDHVKKAVLAAEDDKFYKHGGIDPGAVFRAFVRT